MIKILKKNADAFRIVSVKEFEREMGVKWCTSLRFKDPSYKKKAYKKAMCSMRKKELNLRERWLGVRFSKDVEGSSHPQFSIRYIDPIVGYGAFAEQEIAIGGFIGEYTGVIRKRKRHLDKKNNYCFEYTIGDWVHNPFIIDAKKEGNMTRYMNHSEEPNVESLSVFAHGLMHIIFIAEKRIRPGEQLCYHYGDTFWKKRHHAKKIEIRGS